MGGRMGRGMRRFWCVCLLAASAIAAVKGHGSIVRPPPRNAIDNNLAPWNASSVPITKAGVPPFEPWCPIPDMAMPDSGAGRLSGANGQACFWFSSGCSIGCAQCNGHTRGPIPNQPCTSNSTYEMCARKYPVCEGGLAMPTLPKEARTVNTGPEDGAEDDYYQFSPWRAPGSAGVLDPCGVAGGYNGDVHEHNRFGIVYQNTTHAKRGDKGSQLPKRDAGTVWTAGDVVEVSWSINANHGGGYYWRLCKLPDDGSPVTENCFQQTPLLFVGSTTLRWNGNSSTDEEIDNIFVDQGTHPAGSKWAMNPIPRNDSAQTGGSFEPKCKETCTGCEGGPCPECRCTGEWGPVNLEIVDHVALPWMLPEGDYVLGWRWDAEESNQVWGGCADVKIQGYSADKPPPTGAPY